MKPPFQVSLGGSDFQQQSEENDQSIINKMTDLGLLELKSENIKYGFHCIIIVHRICFKNTFLTD
jgi:hypothetical protein